MGKNQAQINYRKKAVKTLYLDLNIKTDADIIRWLDRTAETGGSKSGEIKRACRRMKPQYSYLNLQKNQWQCPCCPAPYTPYPGKLISYCPACGQAIINATGKSTPVDTEAETCTPVQEPETCTPVDTEAETSTPVDTEAETCTPVQEPETCTPVDTEAETCTPVQEPETCTPVDTDIPTKWFYYINKWESLQYNPTPEQIQKRQKIIQTEGRTKATQYAYEIMENHFRRGVHKDAHYTPVESDAETCTPVDADAETSTPVDADILKKAKTYAGKGETYLINYVLKRGKQELQREAIIRGYNKKSAIHNFRQWHEETKEGGEGHAFRPTATRKWGKYGLDALTTPEAEAIPQMYGESAEQWEQDAQEFWRKVDAEIAANAKKEEES